MNVPVFDLAPVFLLILIPAFRSAHRSSLSIPGSPFSICAQCHRPIGTVYFARRGSFAIKLPAEESSGSSGLAAFNGSARSAVISCGRLKNAAWLGPVPIKRHRPSAARDARTDSPRTGRRRARASGEEKGRRMRRGSGACQMIFYVYRLVCYGPKSERAQAFTRLHGQITFRTIALIPDHVLVPIKRSLDTETDRFPFCRMPNFLH